MLESVRRATISSGITLDDEQLAEYQTLYEKYSCFLYISRREQANAQCVTEIQELDRVKRSRRTDEESFSRLQERMEELNQAKTKLLEDEDTYQERREKVISVLHF